MAGESAEEVARRNREKIKRLERQVELWERGAAGERVTGEALAALPAHEWVVFNDVRWPGRPRANIDHVVVGPPGIFVIDSKNWSGRVTLSSGVLRQNGRSRMSHLTSAADAARAIARLVDPTVPVFSVLCLVAAPRTMQVMETTLVCDPFSLPDYLTAIQPTLTPASHAGAARAMSSLQSAVAGYAGQGQPPRVAAGSAGPPFAAPVRSKAPSGDACAAGPEVAGAVLRRPAPPSARQMAAQATDSVVGVLRSLPAEDWVVFRDVPWPGRTGGRIPVLAFGLAGIFSIVPKAWAGEVSVRDGSLYQDRRRRDSHVEAVVAATHALGSRLDGVCKVPVFALICVARDEIVAGRVGQVLVCSKANLTATLVAAPPLISKIERDQLIARFETVVGAR